MFADLSHFAKEVIDGMVGHLLGDVHQTAPSYASVRLVFYICLLIDLALILWLRRRRKERDAGRAELEDRKLRCFGGTPVNKGVSLERKYPTHWRGILLVFGPSAHACRCERAHGKD